MNLFDLIDNLDLLPKRIAGGIALVLIAGIAYLPPVRSLYFEQAQREGQRIARIILSTLPDTTSPSSAKPHTEVPAYRRQASIHR